MKKYISEWRGKQRKKMYQTGMRQADTACNAEACTSSLLRQEKGPVDEVK
jgi:hypothetical protein